MQHDLVEERGWFTPQEYMRGLALAQLAPRSNGFLRKRSSSMERR